METRRTDKKMRWHGAAGGKRFANHPTFVKEAAEDIAEKTAENSPATTATTTATKGLPKRTSNRAGDILTKECPQDILLNTHHQITQLFHAEFSGRNHIHQRIFDFGGRAAKYLFGIFSGVGCLI